MTFEWHANAANRHSNPYLCNMDQYAMQHYEMKLEEIYNKSTWLRYELPLNEFLALFPVEFKKGKPVRPEKPEGLDLDRDTLLAVMVAFRQAFS